MQKSASLACAHAHSINCLQTTIQKAFDVLKYELSNGTGNHLEHQH